MIFRYFNILCQFKSHHFGSWTIRAFKSSKNWWGRYYIFYGNSQKLMGYPIINFRKTGGAAALPILHYFCRSCNL